MKNLLFGLMICCSFVSFGQTTNAGTKAVIDATLPDNSIKAITAATLRGTMKAVVDFADTKAGSPNVIVSADGKSVKIKPNVGFVASPAVPIEVDPVIPEGAERKRNFEKFHGNDLWERNINRVAPAVNEVVVSNLNEIWTVSGNYVFVRAGKQVKLSLTMDLLDIDPLNNTVFIKPYDCTPCSNPKFIFTIKYSKL